MRKITYKKIYAQNFLSIGHEPIEIQFNNGLNHITGINLDNPERKNAVGKSVILEIYYYALFGTTIRDIKKEFVLNDTTRGGGDIQLSFDVETEQGIGSYKIKRTLKTSSVQLFKITDGTEEDISKDSISNTNKYICELIGSNPVISKSCDILSLNDNIPFMAKKPEEKRKFIEDIFSLEVFGKMLKDLKEEIKDTKSEYNTTSVKLSEIFNSLETLNNQYNIQKKQNDEREEILNQRKLDLQEEIDGIKIQISINKLMIEDIPDIETEIQKYDDAWFKIDKKLSSLKFKMDDCNFKLKTKRNELIKTSNFTEAKCDKCLQDISHSHIESFRKNNEKIQEEIDQLVYSIESLNLEFDGWNVKKSKIQSKLAETHKRVNGLKSLIPVQTNLKFNLEKCNKTSQELESDLNQTSSLDLFLENIRDTETRKEESEKLLEQLKQKTEDFDACKFILGEEGVKSSIIKRLLEMLNSTIQNYITKLGMTMKCSFDEYFDEHITNDKGKLKSYGNFSGAERKSIDVSCAWAFKDIKNKISQTFSNVEFLDELMDANLDSVGLEKMIDVLKERIDKNKMSVYVISHRPELIKHISGETVNLVMMNKVTTKVDI
jgi:DNA repair exonuclease SbcCD ATPase subunit